MNTHPALRFAALLVLLALAGLIFWGSTREPRRPESARYAEMMRENEPRLDALAEQRDLAFVRQLLEDGSDARRLPFATVLRAVSGRAMIPLDERDPVDRAVLAALDESLATTAAWLGAEGSPARSRARINEVSALFEDQLRERLEALDVFRCGLPPTRDGDRQRSGYPDLRLVHEASGRVFYLDPKLVGPDAWDSSLRSFYFEPKDGTLKVTEDAVHLVIGLGHDGRSGAWSFGPWRVVDLSSLEVRFKAEFQAANRDLYPDTE